MAKAPCYKVWDQWQEVLIASWWEDRFLPGEPNTGGGNMLKKLMAEAKKTYLKLLKAEAKHKTKKAAKHRKKFLLLNIEIGKAKRTDQDE